MNTKATAWRPGPSVCRCCLAEGCYKDISTEYFWMGKREVYEEMLADTFDLNIVYSKSGPNSNSRLICESCISRLRDATDFKRQVSECERTFQQYLDPAAISVPDIEVTVEALDKDVKIEDDDEVKEERGHSDDDDGLPDYGDDDDDDDLDDQPLQLLATKAPKKESVDFTDLLDNAAASKRKCSKDKGSPAKRKRKEKTAKPKVEKKKKETRPVNHKMKAKQNAEVILKFSTVYPFRLRGNMIRCVYCCEDYEDPAEFRHHMDECHQMFTVSTAFAHCSKSLDFLKVECTNLRCRLCAAPFDSLNDVACHLHDQHQVTAIDMKYEIGMQPYKIESDKWNCMLCDKKFPSINKLCRHTTSHYQKFTCDICGRNYLSKEALMYHVRCSHVANHVCRKCWKDFPSAEKKSEHTRNSKPCWPFCCVVCGDRFLSWELKQKHLEEEHGRPKRVYSCPDCDEIFDSRRNCYTHFTLKHTDDIFVCTCCGLKFGNKRSLLDHQLTHTQEKNFQCGICSKGFSRKKTLTQHMWLHSESKRFHCVICDKQFAQKVSLKSHMKSYHPDVSVVF